MACVGEMRNGRVRCLVQAVGRAKWEVAPGHGTAVGVIAAEQLTD